MDIHIIDTYIPWIAKLGGRTQRVALIILPMKRGREGKARSVTTSHYLHQPNYPNKNVYITNVPKSCVPIYTGSHHPRIYAENLETRSKITNKRSSQKYLQVRMALPLGALSASIYVFFLVMIIAISVAHHVDANAVSSSWKHAAAHNVEGGVKRVKLKEHRPPFKPGPWRQAFATFYEGSSSSFGNN